MNTIKQTIRGRFCQSGSTLRALAALAALTAAIAPAGCVGPAPSDGDYEEEDLGASEQPVGTNIALGKPAWQSSTYTGSPASSAAASLAVDGNTDGNFQNGSVTSTNNDPNAYWQVDLLSVQPIGLVSVYNRTDCCAERLSNYKLRVSVDGNTWVDFAEPYTSPTVKNFNVNRTARYVRVELNGTNYLSLAEVQVFSTTNLALGKSAWQTSTYTGSSASSAAASLAVDGNTDGNFQNGSVTHTNDEWQPKWSLDLGSVYNVSGIRLFNRTDCCTSRLSDFGVIVSSDGVNYDYLYHGGAAASETWFTLNRPVRYVHVQLTGQGMLSLAEVQVFSQ